jgi:hypothetical protein
MPDKSSRDLAIVAYRDEGHTLDEAAEKFGISRSNVRLVENQMRGRLTAIKRLRLHPDDLGTMAEAGEIGRNVARILSQNGVSCVADLKGWTLRDLSRIPMIGKAAVAQIVEVARQHGIVLK